MADRRGTNALRGKVRQAERALERADRPEKPFEPWELKLRLEPGERLGDRVASLQGAVAQRGAFTLGPVDLVLGPGERVVVSGRNGSGKSTLLGLLLGDVPLAGGTRFVGRRTVIGTLEQGRGAYAGDEPLLEHFRSVPASAPRRPARYSRSSGSPRSTSADRARRFRPASGRARCSPSCRHAR